MVHETMISDNITVWSSSFAWERKVFRDQGEISHNSYIGIHLFKKIFKSNPWKISAVKSAINKVKWRWISRIQRKNNVIKWNPQGRYGKWCQSLAQCRPNNSETYQLVEKLKRNKDFGIRLEYVQLIRSILMTAGTF